MFFSHWQLTENWEVSSIPHNFCISALFCDNGWRDGDSIFDNQIAFYFVVFIQQIFWLFCLTAMLKLIVPIIYCNDEKDLVYFSCSCNVKQQEEGDQKTPEKNNTLHFYFSVSSCQLEELLLENLYYFSASYLSTSQFIVIYTAFYIELIFFFIISGIEIAHSKW